MDTSFFCTRVNDMIESVKANSLLDCTLSRISKLPNAFNLRGTASQSLLSSCHWEALLHRANSAWTSWPPAQQPPTANSCSAGFNLHLSFRFRHSRGVGGGDLQPFLCWQQFKSELAWKCKSNKNEKQLKKRNTNLSSMQISLHCNQSPFVN